MNKRIMELNISEENKILISKIEKRISSLSLKAQEHFDKAISLSAEKIKDAYSSNDDLVSILEQNDEIVSLIRKEATEIREQHQTNFTREQELNVSKEIDNLLIINNTVEYKDNLISARDKKMLLNKKNQYLQNRNKKRKDEYINELERIELKLNEEKILDIAPMKEDIKLIKKFVDEKKIVKGKIWYLVNVVLLILVVLVIGGAIWILAS